MAEEYSWNIVPGGLRSAGDHKAQVLFPHGIDDGAKPPGAPGKAGKMIF